MSIYEQYLYGVEEGKPHRISFEKNEMRLGHSYLIRDGTYDGELHDTLPTMTQDEVMTEIERLYADYKRSLPNKKSRDHYFKALDVDDLSDADMVTGELRYMAEAKLEAFVLCAKLLGKISFSGWFWKSKADKDLVILKSWIA